jgi:hypothetical protein
LLTALLNICNQVKGKCTFSNGASVAASQQGAAAPDGAPAFIIYYSFIFYFLNGASSSAPQQGVAAPNGAPDFFYIIIYFNLFELCIR